LKAGARNAENERGRARAREINKYVDICRDEIEFEKANVEIHAGRPDGLVKKIAQKVAQAVLLSNSMHNLWK
jgi:hypothetical protein